MGKLVLNPGETLVKKFAINYIKRNWAFPIIGLTFRSGLLFLTTERIVFHKRNTLLFYLGGALAYLSDGKFDFDVPIKQLKEFYRKRAGMLGRALCLVTRDGSEHLFVIKSSEFIQALQETLAAHQGSRLISLGDSRWVVERI